MKPVTCNLKPGTRKLLVNPQTNRCIYEDGATAKELRRQGYILQSFLPRVSSSKTKSTPKRDVLVPLKGLVKTYIPVEKAALKLESKLTHAAADIDRVYDTIETESKITAKSILHNPNDTKAVEDAIVQAIQRVSIQMGVLVSALGIARFLYDDWYNKVFHFMVQWWTETSHMSWRESTRTGLEAAAVDAVATQLDFLPEMMLAISTVTPLQYVKPLVAGVQVIRAFENSNSTLIINAKNWFNAKSSFKVVKASQAVSEFVTNAAESVSALAHDPRGLLGIPLNKPEDNPFGFASPQVTGRDVLRGLLPFGEYLFPGQIQYTAPTAAPALRAFRRKFQDNQV